MGELERVNDLFQGEDNTPEVFVRKLYWLINWCIQRRRGEIATKLGLHRNTLSRYCNPNDLSETHGGGAGGKLTTAMRIIEALDLDWLVVQIAITQARNEIELVELARVRRPPHKGYEADRGGPGALSA